jgi:hypothetical protein
MLVCFQVGYFQLVAGREAGEDQGGQEKNEQYRAKLFHENLLKQDHFII